MSAVQESRYALDDDRNARSFSYRERLDFYAVWASVLAGCLAFWLGVGIVIALVLA